MNNFLFQKLMSAKSAKEVDEKDEKSKEKKDGEIELLDDGVDQKTSRLEDAEEDNDGYVARKNN